MAIANIQSSIPTKPNVSGASREDLELGDVVTVDSVNVGSLYKWTIAYAPEGSTAAFSGSSVAKSPGTFTVDVEGSYLIRLEFTDGTGTTEQFVRLRALTAYGSLKLVAAGETPGSTPVPVDITAVGWADDQNYNLNRLLQLTKPSVSTIRFDFDHTTLGVSFGQLKAGDVILKVFVVYTVAFDDPLSTISIGDSTTLDRFVQSTTTNTNTTNKYELSTLDSISSDTNITYNPNIGGLNTQGSGFIIVLTHNS